MLGAGGSLLYWKNGPLGFCHYWTQEQKLESRVGHQPPPNPLHCETYGENLG